MSKTFHNPLHHVVAVTVGGVEHVRQAGSVWEADGDEAKAWEANPGVVKATKAHEESAATADAIRATGRDPLDSGAPSGTITSIHTPTIGDHDRGLVRDNVEVAQQPTVPATGGGELQAVPDAKAAFDRNLDADGSGGLSHDEFAALEGDEAPDAFANFSDEEIREYADDAEIDLGRTSTRKGMLAKIIAAEEERGAEAQENAEDGTDGDGDSGDES